MTDGPIDFTVTWSNKFRIKDNTIKEHLHNTTIANTSINIVAMIMLEVHRVKDYNGNDEKSQFYKHTEENSHLTLELSGCKVISKKQCNKMITKSLFINDNRLSLNKQQVSLSLKLFTHFILGLNGTHASDTFPLNFIKNVPFFNILNFDIVFGKCSSEGVLLL